MQRGIIKFDAELIAPGAESWRAIDYRPPKAGDVYLALNGGVYTWVANLRCDPHSHRVILERMHCDDEVVVPRNPRKVYANVSASIRGRRRVR